MLGYEGVFHFKRNYIDGYRLSVQAIFPVLNDKMAYIVLSAKAQQHKFTFTIPINAPIVLFAVKVEGCSGGEEDKSHATKGMRIEAVAIIQ